MDRGLQLSKGTVVVSKRLVTPKPSMWVLAAASANNAELRACYHWPLLEIRKEIRP
jgi:hypothetical protein